MRRRSVLALLGVASIGVAAGVGYARFRAASEGRVFWKQMAVDAGGEPESLVVLTVWRADDGSVCRSIHPDYRDAFDGGTYVPQSLHRTLRAEFGSDELYYLVRYDAPDYNGLRGDEGGDAVEVSRPAFNRLQVGDCLRQSSEHRSRCGSARRVNGRDERSLTRLAATRPEEQTGPLVDERRL